MTAAVLRQSLRWGAAGVVGRNRSVSFAGWEILPPAGAAAPLDLRFDLVSAVTDVFDDRDPDLPEDW